MEEAKMSLKKRNMLLIIPHPDDEMLVGGSVLYQFAQNKNWETYVLYTTEGAALYERPEVRMKEAIRALKVMGIPESQIIFLGYGNEWQGQYNIYNAPEDLELVSLNGKKQTSALKSHPEYCFYKAGEHHKFTRYNYKKDLQDVIQAIKPEIIIAVDMDDHQEHMATSLFLDECLHDIIKMEDSYSPLLLKKFAYEGLWKGPDDYFNIPRIPTLNGENEENRTRNPAFLWNERIRFEVSEKCNTLFLCNNVLNKAIKKHISQTGWLCATRLINSDIVYWYRRTDNLALKAGIDVSSGDGTFLNDFKMIDTCDVRNKNTIWENCSWYPSKYDKEKTVNISWKEKKKVKEIVIYESPESDAGKILNLHIELDDGHEFNTGELKHKEIKNVFSLQEEHHIKGLKIQMTQTEGKGGISEIEIYSDPFDLANYVLPIKEIQKDPFETNYLIIKKVINFFESKLFHLKARICLK